jgi:hypothetical protein
MVESVPQGGPVEDDDVSGTMRPKAILVASIALTSALLVTAQTRPAAIPLQSGDIVIRGGLIFDSVRDDAVPNTGLIVRNGTLLEVNADLTGRDLARPASSTFRPLKRSSPVSSISTPTTPWTCTARAESMSTR